MLQVQNLSMGFGDQLLFADASFVVGAGERIGVVGRNGHGKSTLFGLLLGEVEPEGGEIVIPKGYTLGHLAQHLRFDHPTVLDEAASALKMNEDGWVETYRAEAILGGLGFTTADLGRAPSEFSGGFQVRLNLAKVLLSEPNLLLLDEPTNYLDITSVRWLESFLRRWPGELLLITHDRAFMDSVCTHTLGIHRQGVRKVVGGTDKLYDLIAEEEEHAARTAANETRQRDELEAFVRRFRAKATKARQAQSRLKQLEKMGDAQTLAEIDDLEFRFTPAPFPGKQQLSVDDLGFGFDVEHSLVQGLSFTIGTRDRIAIVGPNGRGKTTLLNLLAGELEPSTGSIKASPNTRFGYFGQTNVDRLDPDKTIEAELMDALGTGNRGAARALAGRMLFEGDLALKKIRVLSGGERARVLLGQILARPSNLLLLDEPTNHLDMQSVDTLTDAIAAFEGSVIVVTHDEDLLHAVADRLIVFDGGGVRVFDGTYGEFLAKVGWAGEADANRSMSRHGGSDADGGATSQTAASRKEDRRRRAKVAAERKSVLKPLEAAVAKAEAEIERCEAAEEELLAALAAATSGEDGAASDPGAIAKLSKDLRDVQARRDRTYDVLADAYESLQMAMRRFDDTDD